MTLLLIACGGGAGAVLRYLVAGWGQGLTAGAFPLGTLIVNVSGCLVIGIVGVSLAGPIVVREEHRLAILVGLLGGYTTFSTFGYETFSLLADGQWWAASLNVLLSNALGLAAVWAGIQLARRWHGA